MNKIVLSFISVISWLSVYSQDGYLLSVDKLFELGVSNSLTVKGTRIKAKIADNDRMDKIAEKLPNIGVALLGGYVGEPTLFKRGLASSAHVNTPDWSQNYNLEVSHLIYEGGKLKYGIERADLQRQIAELSVLKDVSDVKLLLIGSYLNLFEFYKQREVIEISISQALQRLHDIKGMERQGMITGSDVLRSELQLSNYRLALTEAENNILIVSVQLDIALGLDENLILVPDSQLLEAIYRLKSYDEYVQEAYANYSGLKIAQSYTKIAEKTSRIVKADYFPKLSVKGSNIMSRPYNLSQDLYANNWNISLSLSYNLSSLYYNKHKMSSAKQTIAFHNVEEQRVMQTIRNSVKAYYIKHNESIERIKTLTISVEQANENYRIVLNKYKNQIAILTDLLDASTLQLEAQLQLTTAKTNAVYTYYQLLNASGIL